MTSMTSELIRQSFLHRVSEPLIAFLQSRYKIGPLAAVAYAEITTSFLQAATSGALVLISLHEGWLLEVWDSEIMSLDTFYKIGIALWFVNFIASPLILSTDLLAVSHGKRTTLKPWTSAFATSRELAWRHIPLFLVLVAMSAVSLPIFAICGDWLLLVVILLFPLLHFLLECVKGAIWQNPSVRTLVASSAPSVGT